MEEKLGIKCVEINMDFDIRDLKVGEKKEVEIVLDGVKSRAIVEKAGTSKEYKVKNYKVSENEIICPPLYDYSSNCYPKKNYKLDYE